MGEAQNQTIQLFSRWVLHNWPQAGLLIAAMPLLIAPAIDRTMGHAVLLIYVWLPLYMACRPPELTKRRHYRPALSARTRSLRRFAIPRRPRRFGSKGK